LSCRQPANKCYRRRIQPNEAALGATEFAFL
jgi:hypothetical protein